MGHTWMHLGEAEPELEAPWDALKSNVPASTDPSTRGPSKGACRATLTSTASPSCTAGAHDHTLCVSDTDCKVSASC